MTCNCSKDTGMFKKSLSASPHKILKM